MANVPASLESTSGGFRFANPGAHDLRQGAANATVLNSGQSTTLMKPKTFKLLDVRPLIADGSEPFSAIRARIDALTPGHGLTVIAPFLPAPLIELLKSEGFESTMERRTDGAWAVSFWKE